MTRKILFRGKNRYRKEWLYGNLSQYRDGNYGIDGVPVETDSVGQFTGMTDKNGKEIFEHDVVRYYDDIEDELVNSHVIYHKESCSFCVAPTELCGDYIGLTAHWQFEVLGNIHDNPDLLNGK